jgi:uncharacterized protein YjiS (DUF1127 family)
MRFDAHSHAGAHVDGRWFEPKTHLRRPNTEQAMSIVATGNDDQFAGDARAEFRSHETGRFLRWLKRFVRRVAIHRQRQVLQELPDWMLKDIGINRSDIDSIAVHLVDGRRDPTLRRELR